MQSTEFRLAKQVCRQPGGTENLFACICDRSAAKVGCRGAKCTEVLLEDTSGWGPIRKDDRGMMKRKAIEGKMDRRVLAR